MSVPALVPYVFFGLCLAVLVWAFWRDKQERAQAAVQPFIPTEADPNKHLRDDIERARLEAERLDAMSSVEFRRSLDAFTRLEPRASMSSPKAETYNVHGAAGATTIGKVVNNVHHKPPQFELKTQHVDDLERLLRTIVPIPVKVFSEGGNKSKDVAAKVRDALRGRGFQVEQKISHYHWRENPEEVPIKARLYPSVEAPEEVYLHINADISG